MSTSKKIPSKMSLLGACGGSLCQRWRRPWRKDISLQRTKGDFQDWSKCIRAEGPDAKGFMPLLARGNVRLGQHVPDQFCGQIYEFADSKEMGQLTAARVQGGSGRLLWIWEVKLGGSLTLLLPHSPQNSDPRHFDLDHSSWLDF